MHANELLHPVLPHLHVIDGRMVSDEQLTAARAAASADSVTSRPVSGPALGAGNGADAGGLGLALGPTLPILSLSFANDSQDRMLVSDSVLPTEFREAPQAPPPDLFA